MKDYRKKIEQKTGIDILRARREVSRRLEHPDLSPDQRATLHGISVALQWVMGRGGQIIDRLVEAGELVAPLKLEVKS